MATLPQEPLKFMNRIQDDINDIFRSNLRSGWPRMYDAPLGGAALGTEWVPTMDINERENEFVIHADLAGVSPENTEIYVEGNTLVIKGERKQSHDEKQEQSRLKEIEHGFFERRFSMPDTIDAEKIDATAKNGILTITIGKRPASKKKHVKIKSK